MIKKKICMVGSYGVGKTSLVRRFVHSIFSVKYQITIGVTIDKKTVIMDDQEIKLLLWDIAGEGEAFSIPPSYLKGSDGYIIVIDGTRMNTYEQAIDIQQRIRKDIGDTPFVVVLNKSDLVDDWELGENILDDMRQRNWLVIKGSAKLGIGVEEAFNSIVRKILDQS
jgi:small GTP-binding protein